MNDLPQDLQTLRDAMRVALREGEDEVRWEHIEQALHQFATDRPPALVNDHLVKYERTPRGREDLVSHLHSQHSIGISRENLLARSDLFEFHERRHAVVGATGVVHHNEIRVSMPPSSRVELVKAVMHASTCTHFETDARQWLTHIAAWLYDTREQIVVLDPEYTESPGKRDGKGPSHSEGEGE